MNCPNCGAYNPEGRNQCWKCDEDLPSKPEPRKRGGQQPGRMGPITWVVLIVLGAVWIFGMCNAPRALQPSSDLAPPPAIVQPLV